LDTGYLETFTNKDHNYWYFNYDEINDMGILNGNDIKEKTYYIFDGICPLLVLEKKEKQWIEKMWHIHSKYKNAYLNIDTKIETNNEITYLTNNYCPICLMQKTEFENHHCIEASKGGSDDYVNRLGICKSCHSIINNGSTKDKKPRIEASINHQIYLYGIEFYKMNPLNNKRFKNKDMGLYENYSRIENVLEYYNGVNDKEKMEYNDIIKRYALYQYKYNRSKIRNIINDN
jgi:hypothetical protein